jgi:photosystem II stability/assembly factor-like uncharacterized protein
VATRLLTVLLACAVCGTAWATVTTVSQGIRHDALFGICLQGEEGIAVGDSGVVLKSVDGGSSWQRQPAFTKRALLDVNCGPGPQFIVGQEGLIFRRNGDGFRQMDSGSDQRLLAVASNAEGLAFAVGGFGTVLRSTDGGDSWEPLSFDWEAILNDFLEPHFYAVQITGDGTVTMAGEFGLVMRSTDNGDNWEVAHKGEESIFGMHLHGEHGFAVGQDGLLLESTDGGASWASVEAPTDANLLDVWFSDEGRVLVTGIRELLVSEDKGDTWRSSVSEGDFAIGWYQRIVAAPENGSRGAVLLAGHGGRIVKLETQKN